MKVLFLVNSLDSGGIENYLLRYLSYDLKSDAIVLCKSGAGGQLEEAYIKRLGNNRIIKFKMGYFNLSAWFSFYQLLKKNKITTICDFSGELSGFPMLIAYLATIKQRITFYRHSSYQFKINWIKRIYIRLNRLLIETYSTKILSNSKSALDFYHPQWSSIAEKYEIIYNGINKSFYTTSYTANEFRKELNIPLDAFVIGHTGRVNDSKNHKTLLKVAETLCEKYPKIHFVLAGINTELLHLNSHKDRIHLLGYRKDISRILSGVDLFYFPSLSEGQPNSLIEAMVTGKAIVASNILPIKETVPQNIFPYLINPLDIESTCNLIEHVINNPDELRLMQCTTWARGHFNGIDLFNQFKKQLL
ncbi:MAG: glycosyltransferase [Phocaeicola sp.]